MDVTKPYEFIGFGAMDVTKPYESIRFGAKPNISSEGAKAQTGSIPGRRGLSRAGKRPQANDIGARGASWGFLTPPTGDPRPTVWGHGGHQTL